jgi:hypothetical protein
MAARMKLSKILGCLALLLATPVICPATSPIGYLDNIDSNGTVYGWAQDPDSPNTAISVHVYSGYPGTLLGSSVANYYHDVVAGSHGFRFTIPENWRAISNTIYVYGIDVTGDSNKAISNGNPYPVSVNVSANDNCVTHRAGGTYQIGRTVTSLAGGRPSNRNSAFAAKAIISSKWVGTGLAWFQCGDTTIRLTCSPRIAGAVSSIQWDNVEFLDTGGHGAALQYIEHDTLSGELYNPTEAGSNADDAWSNFNESLVNLVTLTAAQNPLDPYNNTHFYQHGSSSLLQTFTNVSSIITTKSRPAFWVPRSPYAQYYAYPKPTNTIYGVDWCWRNPRAVPPRTEPYNPPGFNANEAFYSDYGPKPPNSTATTATHSVAAPDALDNALYNTVEPISDFTLNKTVKFGVTGHPNLNNLIKFAGSIVIPSNAQPPANFQQVIYPDAQRFHKHAGSRTLTYNPVTHTETNVTSQPSGITSYAVIATDSQNRYAIAQYTRQANAGMWWVQDATFINFGVGTNNTLSVGTTVPLTTYVIVGTLADVKRSVDEVYTINPPP